MNFPQMIKIRQIFSEKKIENVGEFLTESIDKSGLAANIKPGDRIALTAGSRGIANICTILRVTADTVKKAGGVPFIIPAMGSHGGGTAKGQSDMLESLGITPESTGAEILSSIETLKLGKTESGVNVFTDRNAFDADGIIVINRIKLHTAFHGKVESGLCKMTIVGLGKKGGAETFHKMGMGNVLTDCFHIARENLKIVFGVGIVENAKDETLDLRVVPPCDFEKADSELLEISRQIIPKIPFDSFDILVVDQMGKNISGTGMDTNIIGFWRRFGGEKKPDYSTLIVRSLTPESHGNAMGIGLADLTTKRLVDSIDLQSTYTNAMTSQWSMGRIPITLENDRECLKVALSKYEPGKARIVRIKNTLELEELYVSDNMSEAAGEMVDIEITGAPKPLVFDDMGFLL